MPLPPQTRNAKTLHNHVNSWGLVPGNCPQMQHETKQERYSNTYLFLFTKELLRVPNDCSQESVTVYGCLPLLVGFFRSI